MMNNSDGHQWYPVLGWLLSVFAFTGNSFIIVLVASKPQLHRTTNWFLVSLSVADLGVSLSLFPGKFFCLPNVDAGCHFILLASFQWAFLYASVTNLCVLTMERYLAIVKPFVYVSFMSQNRVLAFICVAWILPFTASFVPFTFIYSEHVADGMKYFAFVMTFVFELFPSVSLLLATTHMLFIARKHARETASVVEQLRYNQSAVAGNGNAPPLRHENRVRSSVAFIAYVVLFFILCYSVTIAQNFSTIILRKGARPKNAKIIEQVQQLLLIVNSAFNPLAYGLLKKDIRQEIRKLARGGCYQRQLHSFQMEQR